MFEEVEDKLKKLYKPYNFKVIERDGNIEILHNHEDKIADREFILNVLKIFDEATKNEILSPPIIVYDFLNEIDKLCTSEECATVLNSMDTVKEQDTMQSFCNSVKLKRTMDIPQKDISIKRVTIFDNQPYEFSVELPKLDVVLSQNPNGNYATRRRHRHSRFAKFEIDIFNKVMKYIGSSKNSNNTFSSMNNTFYELKSSYR